MKYLKRFAQHTEYQDIYGWWGGGAVLPNVSVCDDDEAGIVHYNPKWVLEDVFVTDGLSYNAPGYGYEDGDTEKLSYLEITIPEGYVPIGVKPVSIMYPDTPVSILQKCHVVFHVQYLDNNDTEYIDINNFGVQDFSKTKKILPDTYITDNYPSNYEEYNYSKYVFDINVNGESLKDCYCVKTNRPYTINGFDTDESKNEQDVQFVCRNKELTGDSPIPMPYSVNYACKWIFGKWKKIE